MARHQHNQNSKVNPIRLRHIEGGFTLQLKISLKSLNVCLIVDVLFLVKNAQLICLKNFIRAKSAQCVLRKVHHSVVHIVHHLDYHTRDHHQGQIKEKEKRMMNH
uniref:Uncharacterized protein n=1 Tax=Meloidogyne incognita TaxID=6306 RepID=A0A914KPB2_MELIC